ncbi:MAG: beta-glucuronidase [Clostridia bacterium]|nr:beta-glucuronidase [Clostridia bacterium]
MGRLFDEHAKRKVQSLDGAWKFRLDKENIGEKEGWQEGLENAETVLVPSVWNTKQGLLTYEGVAWYEKSFYTRGGTMRFCFGAVMTVADVWLDGEYLGNHYGGFCQFDFIKTDVKAGVHRLTVRVDNRFDEQSVPQVHVDWYNYGGITRSVTAETLEGICILSSKLDYTLSEDMKNATCDFTLNLYNASGVQECSALNVSLGENTVYNSEVCLDGNAEKVLKIPAFEAENVKLWDEGVPNLYTVSMQTKTDDLFDRVGFRKIWTKNEKIYLNGKELQIRGVNRHEEHPEFGFAFPPALMKRDIDLALEMGCNAFRGSHYPNAQEFLDFLDENGVLFWSEIPIWGCGFSEEALADPVVVERGLNMHKEMVKHYFNHPSIVFWGMHNEIQSNKPAGFEMTKTYQKFLRENGGNRLIVFASNHALNDISYEFTDVICINAYLGWYSDSVEDWGNFIEELVAYRNELGFSDKPILMGEFGAAAIYGWHDDENILWSEEYQAKLISYCLELFHKTPAMAGTFIWQFCDIRTSKDMGLNRARSFNNKGLLNEYRKPKLAYRAAKNLYLQFKAEMEK